MLSSLPAALPSGADYRLEDFEGGANLVADPTLAAFSWAMGTYKYVHAACSVLLAVFDAYI